MTRRRVLFSAACSGFLCALGLVIARGASASPAVSSSGAAAPASEFRIAAPTRVVLKNGLEVLLREQRAVPLVQIQLLIRSGSASDPAGKDGAANLLARLLKRGTATRPGPRFSEQLEFLGGSLDAAAGVERTMVAGEFSSRDFETGMALLAEMVQSPELLNDEVEKERSLVLAELQAAVDDPPSLAARAFATWLFGSHPYGRPLEGTPRSVAGLTRSDLVAYRQGHYAPGNSVLVILGDFDSAAAKRSVDRLFGKWARRSVSAPDIDPPRAVPGVRILLLDKPDATQSQICLGGIAPRRADPGMPALTVDNAVLGSGFSSWLVNELRVRHGLTYSIRSSVMSGRAGGSMQVATFTKNATTLETIQRTVEQLQRMKSGGITPADLEKGRNYVAGLYPMRIESPDDLATEMLDVEFFGLGSDYINRYQSRVREVTLEAAQSAAGRVVPVTDLAIVVVGPASTLREPLSTLGPVTVRTAASVFGDAP